MNIVEELKIRNLTMSTAESLTGGMIASLICDNSGASNYFKGGIVSYTKETKNKLLGLSLEAIEKYGVYSFETVEAMARSIKQKTNTNIAIATSGVAGPGSDENVLAGTVYYCFIINDRIIKEQKLFDGTRNEVRRAASIYAIDRLVELLEE